MWIGGGRWGGAARYTSPPGPSLPSSSHFILSCDLSGGHADLVVTSQAPILFLNHPAASGERLISVIGGELLLSLTASGKVVSFSKCNWEFTSLSLEECSWDLPGPSWECEELVPSGEGPEGVLAWLRGQPLLGSVLMVREVNVTLHGKK